MHQIHRNIYIDMLALHGSKAKKLRSTPQKTENFLYRLQTMLPYEDTRPPKMMMSKKCKIMFMYNMQMIIKSEELSSKHDYEKREQV